MSTLEPASASSSRNPLSKLKRNRKGNENASTSSLVSSSVDGDGSSNGLRSSVDGALEKLKQRARRSVDDRRTSASSDGRRNSAGSERRLSQVLSGGRRRRKDRDASGNRPASMFLDEPSPGELQRSGSEYSLGLNDSGRSSLLTEDSDNEGPPARPTLSPHDSHAGYLTLSSPLIKAQTSPTGNASEGPEPSTAQISSIDSVQGDAETTATTDTLAAAAPPPLERAQSPTDKFSRVFTLPRKKVGGSTESVNKSSGGGGGLGGLLGGGSRRNSLTQKEAERIEAQPEQQDETKTSEERPTTPQASGGQPRINTTVLSTPPNLVSAPTTLITPPTPTEPRQPQSPTPTKESNTARNTLSAVNTFPRANAASQKRNRLSNLPSSRLSNAVSANILTPTIEEAKTPGGTLTSPSGPGGFFNSFFSAAQNAANQLSNSINTSIGPNQKNKQPEPERVGGAGGEEVIPGPEDQSNVETTGEKRQPAVETLGKGELSLSHLGITDSSDTSPMTSKVDVSETTTSNANSVEEDAAARAVSVAYETPVQQAVAQAQGGRPLSVASADGVSGDQTPPRAMTGVFNGGEVKRSGSVRSRISERRNRRHRGSSATTGGTLAAVISASTATLSNPGASGGHRLPGFAVASSKRNKDFHQLFRSVPEDDYLIEDYSAALQRDILLQGRLYVSEGHICFSSNIMGWVTNLVISFDEIVLVEKKSTAVIFPNAIVIQTLHARNVFASLMAREATYDLIIGIWKTSHPNLKSSLNGVALDDSGTGDKTEKAETMGSDEGSSDGSDDDVYDEDADEDDMGSFTEAGGNGSIAGSDIADAAKPVSRKTSAQPVGIGEKQSNGTPSGLANADAVVTGAAVGADYPGPPTHGATECGDESTHYDKPLIDTTIPAPLGKVYSMVWGPGSGSFMSKWLVDDQKSREVSYEDNKTGMDDTHRTFTYSYIKPLNAPVGPKQTKCIVTCTLEQFDLDKAVSVNCSTQTPDVPSGGIFTTKTKYCMMWGPDNTTRFVASCTIEWTGKSWLKGPIEKGANDGQTQYVKDLTTALRSAVTTKPPVKGVATARGGKAGKGKRKKETFDTAGTEAARAAEAEKQKQQEANWGLFEPLRGTVPGLETAVGVLRPVLNSQVLVVVLCLLLAWTWIFPHGGGAGGRGAVGMSRPERMAAYEEIWRREESELWDWLEERTGVNGLAAPPRVDSRKAAAMGRKLGDEKVSERQVDDAIRVTEQRLEALKEAVEKKKKQGKRKA